MANTADNMPPPNRSDSEIEFVLRSAKWRRGHEVLRDLARSETESDSGATPASRESKARGTAARKR